MVCNLLLNSHRALKQPQCNSEWTSIIHPSLHQSCSKQLETTEWPMPVHGESTTGPHSDGKKHGNQQWTQWAMSHGQLLGQPRPEAAYNMVLMFQDIPRLLLPQRSRMLLSTSNTTQINGAKVPLLDLKWNTMSEQKNSILKWVFTLCRMITHGNSEFMTPVWCVVLSCGDFTKHAKSMWTQESTSRMHSMERSTNYHLVLSLSSHTETEIIAYIYYENYLWFLFLHINSVMIWI